MGASPLALGGVVEELRELVRSPLETDEFRRALLRAQADQLDALNRAFAGEVPLTGGLFQPRLVGQAFNKDIADAGDPILAGDIEPTTQGSVLRALVAIDTSVVFDALVEGPEGQEKTLHFNQNTALAADSFFIFDLPTFKDVTVNYTVGTGGVVIQMMVVQEIVVAGP